MHYSPLRYPGGKNFIFPFISNILRENNFSNINYAEPYAGGAGLALRLLSEGYVKHIYINDLNKAIYAFWISILNETEKFCQWIQDITISIENWQKYKQIQKNKDRIDLLQLAKSTFFLNRTNMSGIIKGGVIGGLSQKGKYKIDARFNKKDLINKIQKIASLKHNITLSNLDSIAFIKKLNRKKEDIFMYLDPPYYQKGKDLYMNFYKQEDHQILSQYIQKIQKKWITSYDNHNFILNLYKSYKKIVYTINQSTSNRIGNEILILSDQIKFNNSIEFLKSPILL